MPGPLVPIPIPKVWTGIGSGMPGIPRISGPAYDWKQGD